MSVSHDHAYIVTPIAQKQSNVVYNENSGAANYDIGFAGPSAAPHLSLNVPVREQTPPPEEDEMKPIKVEEPSTSCFRPPPLIRNVVCTYALPLHIDLLRVALNCTNVHFDRSKSTIMKQMRHPSCFVKVHNSGKVYIVGCRSEEECRRASRVIGRMVQKIMDKKDRKVSIRNYRICNVLATCKMPFGIKIEEMAHKYKENTQYEPELSVGLHWASKEPKATLRIHTTGSITVTGVTIIRDMYAKVLEFQCEERSRGKKRHNALNGPMPKRALMQGQLPQGPFQHALDASFDEDDEIDDFLYEEEDDDL